MNKRDHDIKKSNNVYHGISVIYPVSNITQLRTIAPLKSFTDIQTDT